MNEMRSKAAAFLVACLCALIYPSAVHARLGFASNAALRVAGNSQFNVSSPVARVNKGGLSVDPTAVVKGNPIAVSGKLDQGVGGAQLSLVGRFDPTAGSFGTIFLEGDNSLNALTPGFVRSNVTISGQNNLLQGSPIFLGNLTLANGSSQVTLAIDSPLNVSIGAPFGGRVDLGKNISFADGVDLPGIDIAFNGYRLSLGGKTPPFKNSTRFLKGADLVLNGATALDGGTWVFCDEAILNANGNVLDLKNGGTLQICPTTTVQISDLVLKSIAQQSLIFEDVDSALELSSVTLEISQTVTTTIGAFSVQGPTTVIIKDGKWTLSNDASFTVDGVTALVDSSINGSTATLIVQANLVNNGAIRYLYFDPIIYLFSDILTSTFLTVTSSFFVPQQYAITFGATTTLDAGGGSIIFTNPDHPQLILLPGANVTLQNVNIENISFNTIQMGNGSSLTIGTSVQIGLNTDITLTNGLLRFNAPGGTTLIRGETLSAINLEPGPGHQGPLIDLGSTTVILENIELNNPQYITYGTTIIDGVPVSGAIDLAGNSIINVTEDIDLNIIVEKFDNYLRLLNDNIQLSGSLNFFPSGENFLHIVFFDFIPVSGIPTVHFVDNYLYLASATGRAHLIFDNFNAQIDNEGGNSFVMDTGGVLAGQNLIVNTFPIKLLSSDVEISAQLQLASDQPNAIDGSFVRSFISPRSKVGKTPGIAGMPDGGLTEREREALVQSILEEIAKRELFENPALAFEPIRLPPAMQRVERASQKPEVGARQEAPKGQRVEVAGPQKENDDKRVNLASQRPNQVFERLSAAQADKIAQATQAPKKESGKQGRKKQKAIIPPSNPTTYTNTVQLSSAEGNIVLNKATVTAFGISQTAALNLTMQDGAMLQQGADAVELKNGDVLNIVGLGNVIRISNAFRINGILAFDVGAELTIEFEERTSGDLTIVLNSDVLLEAGAILRVRGKGIFQLNDGITVTLGAATASEGDAQLLFDSSATLKLDTDATAIIDGTGIINCTDNGGIYLDRNCNLYIGQNTNDVIDFSAISGVVRLEIQDPEELGFAQLSFAYALSDIQIINNGIIYVGSRGRCEINVRDEEYAGGTLGTLGINLGGFLFVDTGGTLYLAENSVNRINRTTPPFSYLTESGFFRGSGLVSYLTKNDVEVTAQLGDIPGSLYKHITTATMRDVAYSLIQQSSNLTVSTLYFLEDGTQIVRTNKGVLITLTDGDQVLADDANGTIYVFNIITRDNRAYGADGRRL